MGFWGRLKNVNPTVSMANAVDVPIADEGTYFTGINVEAALQEIGADLSAINVEGTFTPTLKGDSTAGTFTYTAQIGLYQKNGNFVKVVGTIATSGRPVAPVGGMFVDGLPFLADGTGYEVVLSYINFASYPAGTLTCSGYIGDNSGKLILMANTTGTPAGMSAANVGTTPVFHFSAFYKIKTT